ncbi:hypothetical protein N9L68_00525 [bacterium]|nr:hypothetical protein [bacterium]
MQDGRLSASGEWLSLQCVVDSQGCSGLQDKQNIKTCSSIEAKRQRGTAMDRSTCIHLRRWCGRFGVQKLTRYREGPFSVTVLEQKAGPRQRAFSGYLYNRNKGEQRGTVQLASAWLALQPARAKAIANMS